jgi:hypothetical protein
MFEFLCDEGHVSEQLVDDSIRESTCRVCGVNAVRVVSSPNIKLEGITGAFPGAYERWERVRAEKLAQEKKKAATHGE